MQKEGKECSITADKKERFISSLLYMGMFACPNYKADEGL